MDIAPAPIRERIWVTKYDHSTEPPTAVEEVFIENGVVMEKKDLRRAKPDTETERVEMSKAETEIAAESQRLVEAVDSLTNEMVEIAASNRAPAPTKAERADAPAVGPPPERTPEQRRRWE